MFTTFKKSCLCLNAGLQRISTMAFDCCHFCCEYYHGPLLLYNDCLLTIAVLLVRDHRYVKSAVECFFILLLTFLTQYIECGGWTVQV
jgi:hypothetical protein